jgi:hypothetical protein
MTYRDELRANWDGPTGQDWTPQDVEAVAQAILKGEIGPWEQHDKLGPFPPDEFLEALGRRMHELNVERFGGAGV